MRKNALNTETARNILIALHNRKEITIIKVILCRTAQQHLFNFDLRRFKLTKQSIVVQNYLKQINNFVTLIVSGMFTLHVDKTL